MTDLARPIFNRFGVAIDQEFYKQLQEDLKVKPLMEVMEYHFQHDFDPVHLKQFVLGVLNLEMCKLGLKKAREERDSL